MQKNFRVKNVPFLGSKFLDCKFWGHYCSIYGVKIFKIFINGPLFLLQSQSFADLSQHLSLKLIIFLLLGWKGGFEGMKKSLRCELKIQFPNHIHYGWITCGERGSTLVERSQSFLNDSRRYFW
jgi:hypothetical protein